MLFHASHANTTAAIFDRLNRQIKVVDAHSGVTTTGYDARDNITSITDARNSITRCEFNMINRKIKQIRPASEATITTYDVASDLASVATASGRKRVYTHDALNRKIKGEYYDAGATVGSTSTTIARTTTTYDKLGNLLADNDTETTAGASSLTTAASNSYDELDRQIGQTINCGHLQQNAHLRLHPASRLLPRTDPGAGAPAHTMAYDAAGRVQKISLPTSLARSTSLHPFARQSALIAISCLSKKSYRLSGFTTAFK